MKHISQAFDVGRFDHLIQQNRDRSDQRIAEHGWNPGVRCTECGDTGINPDTDNPCECCNLGKERAEMLIREIAWRSLIPRKFQSYELRTHPVQPAAKQARDWIQHGADNGQNLLLLGKVARGKTGLGIGALRNLHFCGARVRFGTVAHLLAELRPNGDREPMVRMRDLVSVPVLMLDDLGTERINEWVAEQLYLLINGRYERQLPTVVTSNLTIAQLAASNGERLVSRLAEDAKTITLTGEDLRTNKPNSNQFPRGERA